MRPPSLLLPLTARPSSSSGGAASASASASSKENVRRSKALRFASIAICALTALTATSHVATVFYERAELARLQASMRRRATATTSGNVDRPLRVLTLGGSVTWGAELSNPDEESYASRIRNLREGNVVHNLALRATGATYPSTCVASMIRDAGVTDEDPPYDAIVLEFSLNGIDGLPLLAKRLRARYPDAVLVYVNLFSVSRNVENKHDLHVETFERDEGVRGHVYSLPEPELKEYLPAVFKWFASDRHHLNRVGHMKVADEIMKIVAANADDIPEAPRSGSWGAGDLCYNWFVTGTPPDDLTFSGGEMVEFDKRTHKFAYEIPPGGRATIQFDLPMTPSYQEATSAEGGGWEGEAVYVNYMSKGDPSKYPKTRLSVVPRSSSEYDPTKSIELNPFSSEWSRYHVSLAANAGFAVPGMTNAVHAVPQEETEWPLRIVSLTMCGACREMGVDDLTQARFSGRAD